MLPSFDCIQSVVHPRGGTAVEVAIKLVPMVCAEISNNLFHPFVCNLCVKRVNGVPAEPHGEAHVFVQMVGAENTCQQSTQKRSPSMNVLEIISKSKTNHAATHKNSTCFGHVTTKQDTQKDNTIKRGKSDKTEATPFPPNENSYVHPGGGARFGHVVVFCNLSQLHRDVS